MKFLKNYNSLKCQAKCAFEEIKLHWLVLMVAAGSY